MKHVMDSIRERLFGFIGSRWHSWGLGFVGPCCECWALCGGCHWQRRCVVVVVVDGRKEVCHML